MKHFLSLVVIIFIAAQLKAQCIELSLQSTWLDDELLTETDPNLNWVENVYNEIWGLNVNNREFAVMGSYEGTHIIDVTNPQNPTEVHFVAGADMTQSIIHRDYHDYNGYLYAVADEGASTLQIIDISNLPTSVNVVYDSNSLISTTHNIFIDTMHAKLYTSDNFQSKVISLVDPENPSLLYYYNEQGVHDLYVKDNIGYVNMGSNGLYIVDYTSDFGYNILGTLTSYPDQGYNHSGWLSDDGKYYVLADETWGQRLKVLNVDDPTDITVVSLINEGLVSTNSIPHNVIIKDDLVYVSYYQDGIQVFSIEDPSNPEKVAEYDTYDGGAVVNEYRGAWGVYPYLESGNILVSDMQTGLYVVELAPQVDFTTTQNGEEVTFNIVNDGIGGQYWIWDFGNGNYSNEENPTVTFSENGTYTVCLTTGNTDCSATLCEEIVISNVGIEDFDNTGIDAYLNGSLLHVNSQSSFTNAQVSLVDLSGKVLFSRLVPQILSGDSFEFNLPNDIPSGIVLLNIHSDQDNFSHKMLQP